LLTVREVLVDIICDFKRYEIFSLSDIVGNIKRVWEISALVLTDRLFIYIKAG
jgi:hypothetical protein